MPKLNSDPSSHVRDFYKTDQMFWQNKEQDSTFLMSGFDLFYLLTVNDKKEF